MKTITIRDLRQRWPEAEALLETENEIHVTRDSKPVARLVRYMEPGGPCALAGKDGRESSSG